MKILDLTCGWRWTWFEPQCDDAVYVDIREEVEPQVVADSRKLPFRDGEFGLVVFDPPHVNVGARSRLARDYGHHTSEGIRDIVGGVGREAWRVTGEDGLMAFKWNDHDQTFGRMLELLNPWWTPMFGHKMQGRGYGPSRTRWAMLRRIEV